MCVLIGLPREYLDRLEAVRIGCQLHDGTTVAVVTAMDDCPTTLGMNVCMDWFGLPREYFDAHLLGSSSY